jgi:hypothetical protein
MRSSSVFVGVQTCRIPVNIVRPFAATSPCPGCGRKTLGLHMTPVEEIFNDAMELAQRAEHSDQSVYWGGYLTGLMRAFFGWRAVSNSQHGVLSDPDIVGDVALGYRDGYHKLADCPGWDGLDGARRARVWQSIRDQFPPNGAS